MTPRVALWLCAICLAGVSKVTATPLQFDHLMVEDGLSQGTVTSIVQDTTGFMWFGTQEGLNRYDGHRVAVYTHRPQDPTSLPDISVTALAVAPQGEVWIGTANGLARWQPSTDTILRISDDPSETTNFHIRVLLYDRQGALWVGTESRGLMRYEIATGTFQQIAMAHHDDQSSTDTKILALFEASRGRLWVGMQQGLAYLDAEQRQLVHVELPRQVEVRSLSQGPDGHLMVGTLSGLYALDTATLTWRPQPLLVDAVRSEAADNDIIRAQLLDRQGRFWVGTDDGLVLRQNDTIRRARRQMGNPTGLSGNRITAIYQDRSGMVWIASHGGVCRYRQTVFDHIFTDGEDTAQLSHNSVLPFSQGPDGDLWVGTLGGGLNRMDRQDGRFRHYRANPDAPDSLSDDAVSALHHDHQGRLWVGTMWAGLCRQQGDRDAFTCFAPDPQDPLSLASKKVSVILEDTRHTLWIGTQGGGLHQWLGEGRFKRYRHDETDPESLIDDRVVDLELSGDRRLWVATLGGGLSRLDRDADTFDNFRSADEGSGLSHDTLTSLLYDASRDILWIGTEGGGLNRLDQPNGAIGRRQWSQYGRDHGMISHTVNGLAMDVDHQLWLSTNRGISRFNPDDETFVHFDTSHGLQDLDFTLGSVYRNPSGELFFGGRNGFNIIRPDELGQLGRPPPLVLTGLSRFNRPMALPRSTFTLETVDLAHDDHFLTFEVAALDYVAPGKNTYRYRLLGFDPGWVELGPENIIRFAKLEPGDYTLEVQAASSRGLWNRQGLRLDIHVRHPWWQTPWAYGAYALLLLLIGWGLVRRQHRKFAREQMINQQLMEVDRMKDAFLANTSHELRTPLHGITGLAESLLQNKAGELPDSARESLEMIVDSGHRLSDLVDDILDFQRLSHQGIQVDLQPTHLRPLVHLSLALAKPLLGDQPIELVNRLPMGLPPVLADENRVKQILINLIGNAIKFTEQGSITVSCRVHLERVVIEVSDTGVGIPKSKLKSIFEPFEQADPSTVRSHGGTGLGLTICRQLTDLMQGELWVESNLGQGSRFSFSLPRVEGPPPSPGTESRESFRHMQHEIEALRREVKERKASGDVPAEPRAEGARILVVDDESINRQVLRNYLTQEHHGLTFADHGEAALQLLGEHSFDLVLLDVMMPQMSGYEVCRILRTEFSLQELPVIFLTAKGQETDVMEGIDAGANDYLTKPISRGELLSRIRPHLQLVKIYRQLGATVENKITQIRILRGLLPICAQCKKIRDEDDQWQHMESYLDQHSEARFSHSICPTCAHDLYPGLTPDP